MEFKGVTNVWEIARIAHQVNKAYCQSIDDYSQVDWEEAPKWQQDSATEGVQLHLENDLSPEESHRAWMRSKVEDGWEFGKVKDIEKKTHPCIVGYNKLPHDQRVKDYLFKAVVDAFRVK